MIYDWIYNRYLGRFIFVYASSTFHGLQWIICKIINYTYIGEETRDCNNNIYKYSVMINALTNHNQVKGIF